MWPLIIAGAVIGGVISSLTNEKRADKGANVIKPKGPKLEQPITERNGATGGGGSPSGVDPENDHSTSNEGLTENEHVEQSVGT